MHDRVPARAAGAVLAIQRDAVGVVVVQQVVPDRAVAHAVTVDAGCAGAPVVVDDVLLDQRLIDNSAATLAQVTVEMDSRQPVTPYPVCAHDRTDAAVGNVDPVLLGAVAGDVVLDQQLVAVTAEDAPGAVAVARVVANHDIVIVHRANAGARDRAGGVVDLEPLHNHEARAFNVDTVERLWVARVDDRAGFGMERDGPGRCAASFVIPTENEAGVRSRAYRHDVVGLNGVRGVLKREPRMPGGAVGGVAAGRLDVPDVTGRRCRRLRRRCICRCGCGRRQQHRRR